MNKMKRKIVDAIAVVVMALIFFGFKKTIGFDNTLLLIGAMVLIELWVLNDKN